MTLLSSQPSTLLSIFLANEKKKLFPANSIIGYYTVTYLHGFFFWNYQECLAYHSGTMTFILHSLIKDLKGDFQNVIFHNLHVTNPRSSSRYNCVNLHLIPRKLLFFFQRERGRENMQLGEKGRGRENLKQAPYSVQSLTQSLIS